MEEAERGLLDEVDNLQLEKTLIFCHVADKGELTVLWAVLRVKDDSMAFSTRCKPEVLP